MASWSDLPTRHRGGIVLAMVVGLVATWLAASYLVWNLFIAEPRDLSVISWPYVSVMSAVALAGWIIGVRLLRSRLAELSKEERAPTHRL